MGFEKNEILIRSHYKKNKLLRRVFCSGWENRHYSSHIAALFRTTLVHEIYCNVQLDRHNIYVLVAFDVAIATLHQTAAIDISFCGILQQWYIKLLQYMCFSNILFSYSNGIIKPLQWILFCGIAS